MKTETRILAVLSGAFPEADKEYMEQISATLADLLYTENAQIFGAIQVLHAAYYTPVNDQMGRTEDVISEEVDYYITRLIEVAENGA